MTEKAEKYDLEERTSAFGVQAIHYCRKVPFDPITSPLISQLVRSANSIGANYGEANDAESKKDFRHKIAVCRKESKECKHHLRTLAADHEASADIARGLWKEAKELNLIFGKIIRSLDSKP